MKKLLPYLHIAFYFFVFVFISFSPKVYAQTSATGSANTIGIWVIDPEVTFIGKNAARAGMTLDWALRNYNWVCVKAVANSTINPINFNNTGILPVKCDDSQNPLAKFWQTILTFIVLPSIFLIVLAAALIIIVTRGRSLTFMRFFPRFVAVILLIAFSYALVQFIYQFTDVIQGFFLRTQDNLVCPPDCISQRDLLYVGWKYEDFQGLRQLGDGNTESAFITLLLTKLTALTYFVMVGILIVRKIILWFFIIISPVFPLLLLFYPVRNTGKIWIGEFFRWLLYAPLFAIFLKGLVFLWRNQIPMMFYNPNIGNPNSVIFPTAVNILLGGPKQFVTYTQQYENSVNLPETFALYVVALIMLWVVIILPFILLQIFLDYASNLAVGDTTFMRNVMGVVSNKIVPPPQPIGPGPIVPPGTAGEALSLPFAKKIPIKIQPTGSELEIPTVTTSTFTQTMNIPLTQAKGEMLALTNLSLPTMRDIAKYETSMLASDKNSQIEVTRMQSTLEKIANPTLLTSTADKDRYVEVRERLERESQQGNVVATSILQAANMTQRNETTQLKNVLQQIANPTAVPQTVEREKIIEIRSNLEKESQQGNQVATTILQASQTMSQIETKSLHEVLEQIAKPESIINTVEREKVTELREKLEKESQQSNQLASSILSVTNTTSTTEIEKIKDQLREASQKGDTLATTILNTSQQNATTQVQDIQQKLEQAEKSGNPVAARVMSTVKERTQQAATQTAPANVPVANRVQTVSTEDYEAVRKMWKENYQNVDLPQGVENRKAWMKQDVENIDNIVSLLTSQDQEKMNEGMQQVSNILPFLMVGGFSQTEIVQYLKAKQEAAKEVLETVEKEETSEETMVSVQRSTTTTAHQTMTISTEENENQGESSLANVAKSRTTVLQPEHAEIYQLVNLTLPTMTDIARFETTVLSKDTTQQTEIQKIQEVLQQIANPSMVAAPEERVRVEQLRSKLEEESQKGNAAASLVLTASTQSTLKTGEVPAGTQSVVNSIPQANPVQQVSVEDYEAVKKMWKESYQHIEVPAGIENRKAWMKQDVEKMDAIVNKLTSSDQQKVAEGMQEVSDILPFLLLGGFSQTEIVSYLKAKQEAAKEVLETVEQEESSEDTMVNVQTQQTQTHQTMTLSEEVKEENTPNVNIPLLQPQESQVLQLANIGIPTIRDIVQYETTLLSKDAPQQAEVQKVNEVLQKIANPEVIQETTEREHFTDLREKLIVETTSGNQMAGTLLATANTVYESSASKEDSAHIQTKIILSQIANPSLAMNQSEKEAYMQLHDSLMQAGQQGDQIASSILSVTDKTSITDITKIEEQLREAKEKGNSNVQAVLAQTERKKPLNLPNSNRIQTVSLEDYEAVRKMWEENYKTVPVPEGWSNDKNGRKSWLKKEIENIMEIINLLMSSDPEQQEEGLRRVQRVLPFLMLGGFSIDEIVSYLKSKMEAAKAVLTMLEGEDSSDEMVDEKNHSEVPNTMTMSQEVPDTTLPENTILNKNENEK